MNLNTSNLKDTITTIAAIVTAIAGAINTYLQSTHGDINWFQLVITVTLAVGLVLTGKTPAGTTKTPEQVVAGNDEKPVVK
jgi:uncharacterized membrane protein YjjP (DUF1212 family)